MNEIAPELRWMRSANLRRRYLVWGDGVALAKHLRFHSGTRGLLERIWLLLAGLAPRHTRASERDIDDAWREVIVSVGQPTAAFFLDTSFYKQTTLVGPLELEDGSRSFLKLFTESQDAEAEAQRAKTVAQLASDAFRIAQLLSVSGRAVLFELIPHGKQRATHKSLVSSVLGMCERSRQQTGLVTTWSDYLDLPLLYEWLRKDGHEGCASLLKATMPTLGDTLELALAHGDCTPWNFFSDAAGRWCLIDYEEVRHRPPFTDYFHLLVQPRALRRKAPDRLRMLRQLLRLGYNQQIASGWLIAYLVDELEHDLRKRFLEHRSHPQLSDLIACRVSLLQETIHAEKKQLGCV